MGFWIVEGHKDTGTMGRLLETRRNIRLSMKAGGGRGQEHRNSYLIILLFVLCGGGGGGGGGWWWYGGGGDISFVLIFVSGTEFIVLMVSLQNFGFLSLMAVSLQILYKRDLAGRLCESNFLMARMKCSHIPNEQWKIFRFTLYDFTSGKSQMMTKASVIGSLSIANLHFASKEHARKPVKHIKEPISNSSSTPRIQPGNKRKA
ncbi:hypothetical protein K440DRAFT_411326 [Wilcoxina mikolae CBS 423.85]|nr:hypothetical protein K440DRAFT_411326 [Wilcoxina mikolae CBS 423.85]